MLGEVVTMVVLAAAPSNSNFLEVYPVLDPIESHVNCLGAFELDASVGKGIRCGVICGD